MNGPGPVTSSWGQRDTWSSGCSQLTTLCQLSCALPSARRFMISVVAVSSTSRKIGWFGLA